jgi:ABC-2 type transport system permease protein
MSAKLQRKLKNLPIDQNNSFFSESPVVRSIGIVNWRGLWTLYLAEVKRFYKVRSQALIAPIITTLLFFLIFTLALDGGKKILGDLSFSVFLAPGLIMMSILQSSFANTSSSILVSKVQGNIVDTLMSPLSSIELTTAYVAGGLTRGLLVGFLSTMTISIFVNIQIQHLFIMLFYALGASIMLSLLGLIGGIWAKKFDHVAAMTNFIIVPLSFLSGTFYSIDLLPKAWQNLVWFNPFFYAIDGFRYGFINRMDGDLWLGILIIVTINTILFAVACKILAIGYKLKS